MYVNEQSGIVNKYKRDLTEGKKVPDFVVKNPGGISPRDGICENSIFGEGGMAIQYDGVRGDMYFILDDGWDVEYYLDPWKRDMPKFGSHILNDDRFPSTAGKTPQQKLKWINQKLRDLGWKGAALLIPAQMIGQPGCVEFEKQIPYWKERMRWSRFAGIKYWKVDWGYCCNDSKFRKALTTLAAKEYPELIIENAFPIGIVFANDIGFKDGNVIGSGEFSKSTENELNMLEDTLSGSNLFRTYDEVGAATTLDRIAYELEKGYKNGYNFYLTCESNPRIAAGLACYVGIMIRDKDPRSRDAIAFLRW